MTARLHAKPRLLALTGAREIESRHHRLRGKL